LPAIIAAVLIVLLAGTGIFLATRGGSPTAQASPTPSAKGSPKASPTPTNSGGPQAVPAYAPTATAPVTNVAFCVQPSHPCQGFVASDYPSCKINGPCKVAVEIKFSTVQRGNVAFTLKYFDRCTGTTTDLPGGNFTPPGFNRVDIDKVVSLPTGAKSAALVAVTTTPAVAASAPLLLGSTDTC
jgi:hypothetical protein